MVKDKYDGISIGDLVTERWLERNAVLSRMLGKGYFPAYDPTLDAQTTPNVKKIENDPDGLDESKVYVIVGAYNPKGGLDVNLQDQTSDIIDYFMCRTIRSLELAVPTIVDDNDIEVVDATGVIIGSYVCIQEEKRAFQAQILNIVAEVITLDTPLDFNFTVAAFIEERTPEMNVAGSAGSPISAVLNPVPGVKWDVTRIILAMTHGGAADDSLFGNIAKLTNGIVLRKSDGIHHTIFNAKSNGDLRLRAYDVDYTDKAGPGLFGTSMRRSFAGQAKNGVVIRLDGDLGEMLEILIQDDLSTLTSFRIVAQGHIVE